MKQETIVLNHLQEHGTITSWEAITKYHITRLSEMIRRLRAKGHNITTERVYKEKDGETVMYGIYTLK